MRLKIIFVCFKFRVDKDLRPIINATAGMTVTHALADKSRPSIVSESGTPAFPRIVSLWNNIIKAQSIV